ncbi:MAG: carbon storage regulator CsrA [Planctomycetota bacterium]
MLVLSRKQGEAIMIGPDIEVVVLEVRGDRVKLGFRGPADVPIHRAEVHRRIVDGEPKQHAAHCG